MASSPRQHASYAIPVRQASALPSASFSMYLTIHTLPLGYVLPLTGRTRDLHPLDVRHAWRTTQKAGPPEAGRLVNHQNENLFNYVVMRL